MNETNLELSTKYLSKLLKSDQFSENSNSNATNVINSINNMNITTRKQYVEFIQQMEDIRQTFLKQNSINQYTKKDKQLFSWSYTTNIEIGMYLLYLAISNFTIPISIPSSTTPNNNIVGYAPAFQHKITTLKNKYRLGCIGK